jgi:heme-degrading monooxygenase HmoA
MSRSLDKARFAVIFTSQRSQAGHSEYSAAAERMDRLARAQPGFVDVVSARDASGLGITVSYWESLEAVRQWGRHPEHLEIQRQGREQWYDWFDVAVASVDHTRRFVRPLQDEPEDIQRNDQQHQPDDKQ